MGPLLGGSLLVPERASALLWLLPALPLCGSLICALAGARLQRWFGHRVVSVVAVTAMLAATACALFLVVGELLPLPPGERCLRQVLWPLFSIENVQVTFGLMLDALSAVMILVVTGVGTLIHIYAAGYMKHEPSLARFFVYLNLFVFSMLVLVLGDGFVPLFFGWEGVGVCSYLLIGFWFRRPAAADAATKAFIVNRVGDGGFVVGICLLLWAMGGAFTAGSSGPAAARTVVVDAPSGAIIDPVTGDQFPSRVTRREVRIGPTLGFRELADQVSVEYGVLGRDGSGANARGRPFADVLVAKRVGGVPVMFVVCVLFFFAAAGKSAQLPLFAWLPDAMVGPTPVSALIHAATMVTAGVYLIARLGFLFALSPGALTVIAVVGALTAFMGAVAACLQWDLKRVLAYSTVSQLGFMFVAVGAGAFSTGIFHVVTHAFFKACLFLAAGSVIHAVNHIESGESSDPQDMRNMGGLAGALPWTRRGYLIACLAISGFPIASGFFSKDQIFAAVVARGSLGIPPAVPFVVLALTAGLTAVYMFRSYLMIFFARAPRPEPMGAAHEPSRRMTAVVLVLAAGSILVGPLLGWPRNWSPTHEAPLYQRFLAPVFASTSRFLSFGEPTVAVDWGLQLLGVTGAMLGFLVARALYRDAARTAGWRRRVFGRFGRAGDWIAAGWGFDHLYVALVVTPVRDFARATAWLDRRVFDPMVNAVARLGMQAARLGAGLDRRVVDGAVDGVARLVLSGGRPAARLQSGRIGAYVLGIVGGVAALVVLAYVLGS